MYKHKKLLKFGKNNTKFADTRLPTISPDGACRPGFLRLIFKIANSQKSLVFFIRGHILSYFTSNCNMKMP